MKKKDIIAIVIFIAGMFILGLFVGVIVILDEIEKTNLYAQDCFIKFNKDFQGFKTCFWAKIHDYKIVKMPT